MHSVSIFDSLKLAKEIRPGQRNNLDALCKSYNIDNTSRSFHGALLDAQLLGDVYIAMTRGQEAFSIDFAQTPHNINLEDVDQDSLVVTHPNNDELQAHNDYISTLKTKSG